MAIRSTNVVNADKPEYNTEGGNDTTDKVYLLSIDEVLNPGYGFTSAYSYAESRIAKNTAYATAQGAWTSTTMEDAGNWWLRSPGYYRDDASHVSYSGDVRRDGNGVNNDDRAVRPALHLNLSSASGWSYAGKISSNGEETEIPSPSPKVTASPVQTAPPAVQKPGKVTGLKLKAVKKGIQASWKKSKGAAGYEVWSSTKKKVK